MKNLPSLRQLQYFLAVKENKSFGKAADLCNVTQPSLSAAIADLESLLGHRLFDRGRRGATLTRFGEDMVLPVMDLIARAEYMLEMGQSHNRPLSSSLRLGIIPTIAPYILPRLLPALERQYPDLDLSLKEDQTARLLNALDKREIDVILMAFPYVADQTEQLLLWSESFVIAMPGMIPVMKAPAVMAELQRHNIMLLEDGHCLRDHALAACQLQPQKQRKTLGATSLATLIQMVQHGLGSTLLPEMAIDPDNIPSGITLQHFANPKPTRQIGLAWRRGSPRANEFKILGKFITTLKNPPKTG